MSSSPHSSPPQLHLSLPPNTTSFKRSFEHFGLDLLESPNSTRPRSHEPIDGTSSTASSSSDSTSSPDGDENRRKRARSSSSRSEPEDRSSDASSSTLSSFDSENASASDPFSQAPRRHLLLDLGLGRTLGSSVALGLGMAAEELQLGERATSEPPPRIPTPELLESEDVDMPDIDMRFSEEHEEEEEEEQTSPAEHIRRSVDRFNTFDRHISILRSSSPPVIPLPTSLSSRQAELSPPTLPPLPLVDLGLDPEDDEDEPEHIAVATNPTPSTPPRLDLNLPPTTSLSPGPSSPHVLPDEAAIQFRERLDSALDGLSGGNLHFEAPISPPTDERADDSGPSFDHYFEPVREALAATSAGSTSNVASGSSSSTIASTSPHRPRPFAESPLFEWAVPSVLDWDNPTFPVRSPGGSGPADAAQSHRSPPPSPWRRHVRPPNTNNNTVASPDTTVADLRRLLGSTYPPPPLSSRLYPHPASVAAPLSVAATTTSTGGLDVDLEDAYLDLRLPNARAWEGALDRARTLHQQRERERERERREREQRERERAREREIEREREEETERERDNPWSLDSIWETNAGVESFPSARPQPRESSLTRMRRELAEDEYALALTRRRAMERQLRQTLERTDRILDRSRERLEESEEPPERGQSSVSRAARYLESGLVDPREAPSAPNTMRSRLRPPLDTSNPFSVSWASRRAAARPAEDDTSASSSRPRVRRSRSSSQSRDGATDWLGRIEREESSSHFDLFERLDDWLPAPRSVTPAVGSSRSGAYDERDASDYSRRNGESSSSSSGEPWRSRTSGTWQPRLALSPQSAAQPARTPAHARAQSIPSSSLSSSLGPSTMQPSLHRLRQRLYGPPRVGASTSLHAESADAMRRSRARSELMERLNRTMDLDVGLSGPESDDDEIPDIVELLGHRAPPPQPPVAGRDDDRDMDSLMDSDDDGPRLLPTMGWRSLATTRPLRSRSQRARAPSPPMPLRVPGPSGSVRSRTTFEQESEEPPTASSSGLNSRRPLSMSIHPRRPIVRLRQHPIVGGEISPPASATASVDRRHVSWEAPSLTRDAGSYQYLSALSHGFDSQSLSLSDLAHTVTNNSNGEALRSPPSPMWGENSESPFSSLFARSRAPSSLTTRNAPGTSTRGGQESSSSVPSLPSPDLGGDFERGEDMLRSASPDGVRAGLATPSPSSEGPTVRPPSPPSTSSNYTGPFRFTMQRREEALRRAAGAPRRVPDPPSIPPLYFGGDFENSSTASQTQEGVDSRDTRHRPLPPLSSQRPQSFTSSRSDRSESYASARFAEMERRLFNYRGPASSSQTQGTDGETRRFFPSRATPTSSTSNVDRLGYPEEPSHPRRYSATDMHNVLARQARLVGSRLADDMAGPSSPYRPSGGDTDSTDLSHDALSSSRAARLISRYHEQESAAEAEARESSSSSSTSPWAALPTRRSDSVRADEARRRRLMGARPLMSDAEPPQLRHRTFRDPTFHSMFGFHGATARLRRRALGDYMRDEDFDASYENLISLGGIIGDAKPKATPEHILTSLETASYKDWATADSDQRCPICLDDYQPSDPVMKLGDCRHWLHKECLEQWLKGASTCPVCRKDVKGKAKQRHHRHHHHSGSDPSRRRDGDGPGGSGPSGGGSGSGNGNGGDIPHVNWLNFLRD